ncbi:hypothetical protein ASG67_01220 [Sphingomonas sp. Leaf339]|uniref:PilZ domain-containing protein n=1 Tax=Sphingomonas sp. Leaf339 TaxID=1736343 RepID=UPI0006FA8E98|nr:PilZ domain-containing protein [Sphingomonas sp. Leaf339]KQU61827.1 hypothetical protein ASG67_01220 [Sphingomonas sp. Leaf339]
MLMNTQAMAGEPIDGEPTAADRRAGKRHQSVLLIGKVRRGPTTTVCLVHDISRNGLMGRFPTPPSVEEELVIEVRGLPPIVATVRWVMGRKAGLQFAEPQAVEHVFRLTLDDGLVARPPRFPIDAPAIVRADGGRFEAQLFDISAGGAKLSTEAIVATGQTGQVTLVETGTAMFGRICWTRPGLFGFRFCSPLPLDVLSHILDR